MDLKDQLIKLGSDNKSLRKHIKPVLATLYKVDGDSLAAVVGDAKRKFATDLAGLMEERIKREFDVNTGRSRDGGRIDTDGGWSVTITLDPRNKGNGIIAYLEDIDGRNISTVTFASTDLKRKIMKKVVAEIRDNITDYYL